MSKQLKITTEAEIRNFSGNYSEIARLKMKMVNISHKNIDVFNDFLNKLDINILEKLKCKVMLGSRDFIISVKKSGDEFVYKIKFNSQIWANGYEKYILDNLPLFITQLKIDLSQIPVQIYTEEFTKNFAVAKYTNLPPTLKKLNIKIPKYKYRCEYLSTLQNMHGYCNILFTFNKIPFGLTCKIFNKNTKQKYVVNFQTNDANKVELLDYYNVKQEKQIIVKKTFYEKECKVSYIYLNSEE